MTSVDKYEVIKNWNKSFWNKLIRHKDYITEENCSLTHKDKSHCNNLKFKKIITYNVLLIILHLISIILEMELKAFLTTIIFAFCEPNGDC